MGATVSGTWHSTLNSRSSTGCCANTVCIPSSTESVLGAAQTIVTIFGLHACTRSCKQNNKIHTSVDFTFQHCAWVSAAISENDRDLVEMNLIEIPRKSTWFRQPTYFTRLIQVLYVNLFCIFLGPVGQQGCKFRQFIISYHLHAVSGFRLVLKTRFPFLPTEAYVGYNQKLPLLKDPLMSTVQNYAFQNTNTDLAKYIVCWFWLSLVLCLLCRNEMLLVSGTGIWCPKVKEEKPAKIT